MPQPITNPEDNKSYVAVELTPFQIHCLHSLIAEFFAGQPDPNLWPPSRQKGLKKATIALNEAEEAFNAEAAR